MRGLLTEPGDHIGFLLGQSDQVVLIDLDGEVILAQLLHVGIELVMDITAPGELPGFLLSLIHI